MKSSHTITLFHVEDEEVWREMIRDLIAELPNLKYVGLESSIQESVEAIRRAETPAIALLDLRLIGQESEFGSMAHIASHQRELQERHVQVFILSGYVTSDGRDFLSNVGIPEDRVYDKQRLNRSELKRALSEVMSQVASDRQPIVQGPVRIVHLSDMHIGQESSHRQVQQDVRRELLEDLSVMARTRGNAGAIAITGDTAFSAQSAEYQEACEWIALAGERVGCPADMVFVVPGNHDVSWAATSAGTELFHRVVRASPQAELAKNLSVFEQDTQAADLLLAKLRDYRAFARTYGRDFESYSRSHWTHDLDDFGDPKIRLVGLNTVLFSDKNDSIGKLILPQSGYILARESGVEYVALMHHPVEWLRDSRQVRQYLESRVRICMMGHEHELRANKTSTLAGFERLDLYAGAINPPADESGYQFRYNWIELSVVATGDLRELVVALWPRIWTSSTRFAADRNALEGNEYCIYRLRLASM